LKGILLGSGKIDVIEPTFASQLFRKLFVPVAVLLVEVPYVVEDGTREDVEL